MPTNGTQIDNIEKVHQLIQVDGEQQGHIAGRDQNVYHIESLTIYLASRPEEVKSTRISADIGPNPYKGLSAFQEKDADLFFGREALTQQLYEKFCALHGQHPPLFSKERGQGGEFSLRLLAILGPSGSGKSSVARAGLLNELARHPLPGKQKTRVAVFTPGTRPLEALATILARIATNDPTPVAKKLEFTGVLKTITAAGQCDGFRHIADVLPDIQTVPLIILVDQFEEVYSLCADAEERQQFIANLLCAAADPSGHVSVILTLRSDFLGQTQSHPDLNHAVAARGVIIPVMSETELRQAIAQPARLAGHAIDDATIDLLIEQTKEREGALPLLQFALAKIWDGLAAGVSPAETLKQIGGVGGALAGEAQRLFDRLSDADKTIARRAFLGLIQLGEGARDTRRRINVTELVAHGEDSAHVQQVMRWFADPRARLVTLSASTDGTETAEVTHEALLEHWSTLKEWLDDNREDLRFHRHLAEDAHYWTEQSKPDGLLWRSPDLDLLRQYHARAGQDMTPLQMEFFQVSAKKEQHSKLVKRIAVTMVVILALLAACAAGIAFWQRRRADEQAIVAQTNAKQAKEQELIAITQKDVAVKEKNEADRQSRMSLSLAMSSSAIDQQTQENFLRASLLARQAYLINQQAQATTGWPEIDRALMMSALNGFRFKKIEFQLQQTGFLAVAFSPKGQILAIGCLDGTILLRNLEHPDAEPKVLLGQTERVSTLAFSPDGQTLASGSSDKTIRVWDLMHPDAEPRILTTEFYVSSVAFRPDGKQLAAGEDGSAKVWLWNLMDDTISDVLAGHRGRVYAVAYSLDGRKLASGSLDNTVRVWDVAHPEKEPLILEHDDYVLSVTFSPDGQTLVAGSADNSVRLWDLTRPESEFAEHKVEPTILRHAGWIHAVAFNPHNAEQLAVGSSEGKVWLWNLKRLNVSPIILQVSDGGIRSLSFSHDGRYLATGNNLQTLRVWDLTQPDPTAMLLRGHRYGVESIAFSPDGQTLVSGSYDRTIAFWDLSHPGDIPTTLSDHTKPVFSVAFSPDGQKMASGSWDKTIRIWDRRYLTPPLILKDHEGEVQEIAFSPDGKQLASVSWDRTTRLWDLTQPEPKSKIVGYNGSEVETVAFRPDGKRLASGGYHRTVQLWDLTEPDPKPITLPGHHNDRISTVAFSSNSQFLASGSPDKTIQVWNLTQPDAPPMLLRGHDGAVLSVAFSPDSQFLASGSDDKTVRIWNLRNLEAAPIVLKGYPGWVLSVAFSLDGKSLAAGCQDGSILVRNWNAALLAEHVCETVWRNLTLAEWQNFVSPIFPYERTCPNLPWNVEGLSEFAKAGKVAEIQNFLQVIQQADPSFKIPGNVWNYSCWYGSLFGYAEKVLPMCDQSVALVPNSRYSRGLARALTGNIEGAIEDFQEFVAQTTNEKTKAQCQQWIEALQKRENPFTPEVLEQLRQE